MVQGPNAVVQNCEVDGSDGYFELGFGIMGENNLVTRNHVHDLSGMSGDSGDMNTSGGAEAYMVMASNNEISYNSAVNCWGPNQTLGGAEGGLWVGWTLTGAVRPFVRTPSDLSIPEVH